MDTKEIFENLGDAGKYEEQAKKFLELTNSKIDIRFLEHGYHFAGDKDKRDIFEVKLSRGSREYTFKFGDSIANYEKMLTDVFREKSVIYIKQELEKEYSNDYKIRVSKIRLGKIREAMAEWQNAGSVYMPTAYGILACLNPYMYCDNVDDFASEFGYEKPSEASKVFEAVKKETVNLQRLYNDEECQLLEIIN